MQKKLLAMVLSVIMVITCFVGCGGTNEEVSSESGNDTVIWKYAHSEAADTIMDMYAHKFSELLDEASEGKIKLEVYPVGQLGDSTAQLELLQTGGIEFASFAVAEVGTTFPASQVMALNFLFSDDGAVNQKVLTQGEGTKAMNDIFREKNIEVLDWYDLGFMNWTSNKPLHNLNDFKGFKMRIMNTPLISANYEALGASPTAVPFMETYSGLQLNMIEGTEQPINAIQEMKFYEVQNYITESKHSILPCFTGVNSKFWENLSDEDKALVQSVIPELQEYAAEILIEVQEAKCEAILQEKPDIVMDKLTPEEREAFIEASMPVRDKVEEIAGADGKAIMDLIIKDVEKFENETI